MKKIIANLKMNMQLDEIKNYIENLDNVCYGNIEVIVCPSYIHIPFFINRQFEVGSQDVSHNTKGAYTSQISASQLKELGVKYSIIAHSEVRKNFNETYEKINKKLNNCFTEGIIPIVCIGEEKKDKLLNKTTQVIRREILEIFKNLNREDMSNIIIAYEPLWAIGTGEIPNIREIKETIHYIKNLFYSAYKVNIEVLYGGSVNPKNIQELEKIDNCDGFLIGNSSNNINNMVQIINTVNNS